MADEFILKILSYQGIIGHGYQVCWWQIR
jgi:hypothetical protein